MVGMDELLFGFVWEPVIIFCLSNIETHLSLGTTADLRR